MVISFDLCNSIVNFFDLIANNGRYYIMSGKQYTYLLMIITYILKFCRKAIIQKQNLMNQNKTLLKSRKFWNTLESEV